jgi:predicted nucleotidyltransferase
MKKVYIVIHNFRSHDMFVPEWAKIGEPKVFGTYATRKEAEKHIRKWADDEIQESTIDEKEK